MILVILIGRVHTSNAIKKIDHFKQATEIPAYY